MTRRLYDSTGICELRVGTKVRITHKAHSFKGRIGTICQIERVHKRKAYSTSYVWVIYVWVRIVTGDGEAITTRCGNRSVTVID